MRRNHLFASTAWRRWRSLVAAATWCAALAACEASSGVTSNRVDAFPQLVAEAGMRIGDKDDPTVGFSRPYGVDVDRDGNVYVMEAMVPEIRVYSSDGRLLRRMGRRGSGPGEFERAPRFGVVGDTVWAVSIAPSRITLFRRDGTLLSASRAADVLVALPRGYGHVLPWIMRSDGRFAGWMGMIGSMATQPPSGVQPTDSIPMPLVLFDATGAVTDTAGWAPWPPPHMWHPPSAGDEEFKMVQVGGRPHMVPMPPSRHPWWEPLSEGYLSIETPLPETADHGVFSVTRVGLRGDTVYHREYHYMPVRYTSADLDSIAARAGRGGPGGMVAYRPGAPVPDDWQAIANRLRAEMKFPDFKLPLDGGPWLAQDQSLWLRLSDSNDSTAHWVILNDQGRPHGQLELPARVRPMWNRGDTFWAVELDALDVPWLVKFRIRPG